MIFLGKLLQNDDLPIFFSIDSVVETPNKDVINDPDGLLNDPEFTLNTWTTLTESGLVPFDPYFVSYTIFDYTHGMQEIIRQTINSRPMRYGTGHYWAPFKVDPRIFRVGRHLIEWQFKQYFDSQIQVSTQEFDIVRPAAYSGEWCESTYPPIYQFHSIESGVG